MKQQIFALLLLFATFISMSAKGTDPDYGGTGTDRQRFFKEMRDYKHRFLTRQLSLTKEQQSLFFPIYDEMEDETTKINNETREMERKIETAETVSDLEYDKATEALFDLKITEGQIEKEYMNRFKDILTKKQLFMLKSAEKNFNRDLMLNQMRLRKERVQNRN